MAYITSQAEIEKERPKKYVSEEAANKKYANGGWAMKTVREIGKIGCQKLGKASKESC